MVLLHSLLVHAISQNGPNTFCHSRDFSVNANHLMCYYIALGVGLEWKTGRGFAGRSKLQVAGAEICSSFDPRETPQRSSREWTQTDRKEQFPKNQATQVPGTASEFDFAGQVFPI